MKTFLILLVSFLFSLSPLTVWAGGAVAAVKQRQLMEQQAVQQEIVRRQQQEMMRQYMLAYQQAAIQQYVQAQRQAIAMRAAQEQAAQQFMAQRMAEEMAVYQMTVARRQQVLEQAAAMQIRIVQNVQYQQAFQTIAAQRQVQEAVATRMIATQQQKTLAEYQQALMAKEVAEHKAYEQATQAYGMKAAQQAQQMAAYRGSSALNKNKLYEDIQPSYVKDVVPVSDLWRSLDKTSKAWPLIIDTKAKGVTVSHYIQKLGSEGAKIEKDPLHYVEMIDAMSQENPSMLLQPLGDLLRVIAIIEYDYQNGIDKDALARRIFPTEQAFQANKKRLGL